MTAETTAMMKQKAAKFGWTSPRLISPSRAQAIGTIHPLFTGSGSLVESL